MSTRGVTATAKWSLKLASSPDVVVTPWPETFAEPLWVRNSLTDDQRNWIAHRYDHATRTITYQETDNPDAKTRKRRGLTVTLPDSVGDVVLVEVLASLALDNSGGNKFNLYGVRVVVGVMADGGVPSLAATPQKGNQQADVIARRWQARADIAGAHRHAEWLTDSVRLSVVTTRADAGNKTLAIGAIRQPWLRQLTIDVLKNRVQSDSMDGCQTLVTSAGRLSVFLATREDHGNKPRSLTAAVMADFGAALANNKAVSNEAHTKTLEKVSALLGSARSLGIGDTIGLPATFAVSKAMYLKTAKEVRAEKAIPDQTFKLITGQDEIFGSAALDLARSVPGDTFGGRVFVTGMTLGVNFGRRPNELCSLPANRLRIDDRTGEASILYDNFKSGRNSVWLPIDARSAISIQDWIGVLRERFPDAPLDDLKLLPQSTQNPNGTTPIRTGRFSTWFKIWLRLLDMAIILGHLHKETGAPVEALACLNVDAFHDGVLTIDDTDHLLSPFARDMLTDFVSETTKRTAKSTQPQPPTSGDAPLFLNPYSPRNANEWTDWLRPLPVTQFEALGDGWWVKAASYPSPGLPGGNLGADRISPFALSPVRFRHTYLQHLVDIGEDIFIVQELADHGSVATTTGAYVTTNAAQLRGATQRLAKHREDRFGHQRDSLTLAVISGPSRDLGTNDCHSPQVLRLGTEGCEYDRTCYDCDHFGADPSHMDDMKSEIQTCIRSINTYKSKPSSKSREAHLVVLSERLKGWRARHDSLKQHLDSLGPDERIQVINAATIVGNYRNRVRNGSGFGVMPSGQE